MSGATEQGDSPERAGRRGTAHQPLPDAGGVEGVSAEQLADAVIAGEVVGAHRTRLGVLGAGRRADRGDGGGRAGGGRRQRGRAAQAEEAGAGAGGVLCGRREVATGDEEEETAPERHGTEGGRGTGGFGVVVPHRDRGEGPAADGTLQRPMAGGELGEPEGTQKDNDEHPGGNSGATGSPAGVRERRRSSHGGLPRL